MQLRAKDCGGSSGRKLEEAGRTLPLNIQRECGLDLGLRAPGCRGINLCRLQPPSCGSLQLPPPQEVSAARQRPMFQAEEPGRSDPTLHMTLDGGRGWGLFWKKRSRCQNSALKSMGPSSPLWGGGCDHPAQAGSGSGGVSRGKGPGHRPGLYVWCSGLGSPHPLN